MPTAIPSGAATATPSGTPTAIGTASPSATSTPTPLATATPTLAPTATPLPSATPGGLKIYVTNHSAFGAGATKSNPSVTVYAATASGNATPLAVLAGAATQENQIQYPAVDASGDVYVSNQNQAGNTGTVTAYAPPLGNIAPFATFGPYTTPEGVAIDNAGQLYVGTASTLFVYPANATPATAPLHAISGSNTQLTGALTYQVFVDASGKQYLALQNQIVTFAPGADGNATPQNNIFGMLTQLYFVLGVAADSSGTIYATNLNQNTVVEFSSTATGDAVPSGVVTSTSFNQPWGIFIDKNDTIYVANRGNNSIAVFSRATFATGLPTAVISGSATLLDNPIGIAVR
jgi:hypothetical protein